MRTLQNKIFLLLSLFLFISACVPAQTAELATPTEPVFVTSPVTDTPAVPTETQLPTTTPLPPMGRAKYTLNTTIDYDAHTVKVDQIIQYPNLTGNQLNSLVLSIQPNLYPGFSLSVFTVNGEPNTTFSIDGQRMDVSLTSMLPPGEVLELNLQYTLQLPTIEPNDPTVSRPQIYGFTQRQLNLTNWYPFVVPYLDGEWVLHEPWFYGEHLVYEVADFEVNLKFTDPVSAPIVASSGVAEQ